MTHQLLLVDVTVYISAYQQLQLSSGFLLCFERAHGDYIMESVYKWLNWLTRDQLTKLTAAFNV